MSSLGGAIRVGELVPGGTISHALKIELYGAYNYYYNASDATPGYRWPAHQSDPEICGYGGTVPAMRMGSLVALRPDFDLQTLRTTPARILAQALVDYGAYTVDDTCRNVYAISTEWGPDGRVVEEFKAAWNFPIQTGLTSTCSDSSLECQWAKDMDEIFTALHVIDNNSVGNIAGGGARRRPPAPPLGNCQPCVQP